MTPREHEHACMLPRAFSTVDLNGSLAISFLIMDVSRACGLFQPVFLTLSFIPFSNP